MLRTILLLIATAMLAQPAAGEPVVARKTCVEDVYSVMLDPTSAAAAVPEGRRLRVVDGRAQLLFVIQAIDSYIFDGVDAGPAREVHAWLRLEPEDAGAGDRDGVTMDWVWVAALTSSPASQRQLENAMLPAHRVDPFEIVRTDRRTSGRVSAAGEALFAYELDIAPPAEPRFEARHRLASDAGLHRVWFTAEVVGWGGPGELRTGPDVAVFAGLLEPATTYPVRGHAFARFDADVIFNAQALTPPATVRGSTLYVDSRGDRIRIRHFEPGTAAADPATVLLVPGWPAAGDDVLGLGAGLAARGLPVFIVFPRGHEGSGGTSTFAGAVDDVAAVWEWLAAPDGGGLHGVDPDRRVLAGYSWGGGIAMAVAAGQASVRRAISIAGSDHGVFIRRLDSDPAYRQALTAVLASTRAPDGPVLFDLDAALDELRRDHHRHDLATIAPLLADRDLLIVAGWRDGEVEVERQVLPFRRALAASGAASVRLLAYDDDHGFRRSRAELVRDLAGWILGGEQPVTADTVEANKRVVVEMMAAVDRRDLDALDGLVAPDVRRRSGATPGLEIDSLDGFKAFLAADFEAVPDSTQTIHRILGEADLVAVSATYSGTQKGAFGPFPPSGRRLEIPFVAVIRVADGLIREIRVEWDNLNALTQLGHLPAPAAMAAGSGGS